ncbi:MAG: hypothetical protein EOM20_08300 [Spartobacteria bacterium]|nr:hypothetical protein [Spartobacteria bacterium]
MTLLVGARQIGKTTLLKQLEQHLKDLNKPVFLFTLEDFRILELLNEDPRHLFQLIPNPDLHDKMYILIDEIQYLDNPSNFLKLHYDTPYLGLLLIFCLLFRLNSVPFTSFRPKNPIFCPFLAIWGLSFVLLLHPDIRSKIGTVGMTETHPAFNGREVGIEFAQIDVNRWASVLDSVKIQALFVRPAQCDEARVIAPARMKHLKPIHSRCLVHRHTPTITFWIHHQQDPMSIPQAPEQTGLVRRQRRPATACFVSVGPGLQIDHAHPAVAHIRTGVTSVPGNLKVVLIDFVPVANEFNNRRVFNVITPHRLMVSGMIGICPTDINPVAPGLRIMPGIQCPPLGKQSPSRSIPVDTKDLTGESIREEYESAIGRDDWPDDALGPRHKDALASSVSRIIANQLQVAPQSIRILQGFTIPHPDGLHLVVRQRSNRTGQRIGSRMDPQLDPARPRPGHSQQNEANSHADHTNEAEYRAFPSGGSLRPFDAR